MPSIPERRSAGGRSSVASAGAGGRETPLRPEEPRSKTSGSSKAIPRVAPPAPRARAQLTHVKSRDPRAF